MHDEFVGLYSVPQTDAGTITTVKTGCVLPIEPTSESEHVLQTVLGSTMELRKLTDRERVLLYRI